MDKQEIEAQNWPKVLVGAPVCGHYEYCLDKYLNVLNNLDYPNYEVLLVDNSDSDVFFKKVSGLIEGTKVKIIRAGHEESSIKMKMIVGRNLLRQKVLDEGFDYFFNLDQDVIPPFDILKRFVLDDKEIITGVYHNHFIFNGEEMTTPVLYVDYTPLEIEKLKKMDKEELKAYSLELFKSLENNGWNFNEIFKQLSNKDIEGKKLIEITMCGTGCIFISRKVLEKIEFRFNNLIGFDDVVFCKEAVLKGFKIYSDCSAICQHLVRDKPWAWCNVGNEQMILYGANMFKRGVQTTKKA